MNLRSLRWGYLLFGACLLLQLTFDSARAQSNSYPIINGPPGDADNIKVSPVNDSGVYAFDDRVLIRSTDKGESASGITSDSILARGRGISLHPEDARILYVNCNKSTDKGNSWVDLPPYRLTMNPDNPKSLMGTNYDGDILVSRDGGSSWDSVSALSQAPRQIAISPIDTARYYARALGDLMINTNAGKGSWEKIFPNNSLPRNTRSATAIDFMESDTSKIIVGNPGYVYAKDTASSNWEELLDSVYVQDVAVSPHDPEVMYVTSKHVFWVELNSKAGIFKTTDGGETWENVSWDHPHIDKFENSTNGSPYMEVVISPHNPQTVYVNTVLGVIKTTDGGDSWSVTKLGVAQRSDISMDGEHVYRATGNALTYSTDQGKSWEIISVPTRKVFDIIPRPGKLNEKMLIGATALYVNRDNSKTWDKIQGGVNTLLYHPDHPDTVLAGTGGDSSFVRSFDGGQTWENQSVEGTNSEVNITAITVDPVDDETIYIGTDNSGVFKSADLGASWVAMNNGLFTIDSDNDYTEILEIAALPTESTSTLIVGHVDRQLIKEHTGGVAVYDDTAEKWTYVDSTLKNMVRLKKHRSTVEVGYQDSVIIYVGYADDLSNQGNGFYRKQLGAPWEKLNDRLVGDITIPANQSDTVYYTTEYGFETYTETSTPIPEPPSSTPKNHRLKQNYPNPFNPSTTISYQLPNASNVTLTVYNLIGKKVATLVDGKRRAGRHKVTFNADRLASGVYIYRLEAKGFNQSRKMLLLK